MLILVLALNKNIKYVMYDCLERKYLPALITRVIMGNLTYFIATMSIQHLPLLIVNIIGNTTPLVTALMAFFILGEVISRKEFLCLCLAFTGIIILFYDTTDSNTKNK